jgi:hypothetical protein
MVKTSDGLSQPRSQRPSGVPQGHTNKAPDLRETGPVTKTAGAGIANDPLAGRGSGRDVRTSDGNLPGTRPGRLDETFRTQARLTARRQVSPRRAALPERRMQPAKIAERGAGRSHINYSTGCFWRPVRDCHHPRRRNSDRWFGVGYLKVLIDEDGGWTFEPSPSVPVYPPLSAAPTSPPHGGRSPRPRARERMVTFVPRRTKRTVRNASSPRPHVHKLSGWPSGQPLADLPPCGGDARQGRGGYCRARGRE